MRKEAKRLTQSYFNLAPLFDGAGKQRDGVSGVEEADDVFLNWAMRA